MELSFEEPSLRPRKINCDHNIGIEKNHVRVSVTIPCDSLEIKYIIINSSIIITSSRRFGRKVIEASRTVAVLIFRT